MPTLLIKAVDNDGRLAPLVPLLATPWQVVIADHGNHDAFSSALASADALIATPTCDFHPQATLRCASPLERASALGKPFEH